MNGRIIWQSTVGSVPDLAPGRPLFRIQVVHGIHGAGLMVMPAMVGMTHGGHEMHLPPGASLFFAVALHTVVMLTVMGLIAWIFYRKFSLAVLRRNWVNFDLMWAVALLVVGGVALFMAISL